MGDGGGIVEFSIAGLDGGGIVEFSIAGIPWLVVLHQRLIDLGSPPVVTLCFLSHHAPARRLGLVPQHRLCPPNSSDHSAMVRVSPI